MNLFDQVIDRRGTNSVKWNRYAEQEALPAWVADMDFRSPPEILEALKARVAHGIFGYCRPPTELQEVLLERLQRKYDWTVEADWLVWLPGVISGLSLSCRSTGGSGDTVMTPVPIYHPFLQIPSMADRQLSTTPVECVGDRWEFDLDAMNDLMSKRTRLFMLCNPFNPVGRILSRSELEQIGELCLKHDLTICSDEIHCDLLLDEDKPHIPIANLSNELALRTITLISPSKTFNLPGLGGCAVAIIPDRTLRKRFIRLTKGIVPGVGVLAYESALVAYRDCDDWCEALLGYLRDNRDYLQDQIAGIPGLSMTHVEATYLAWIDARSLGLDNPFEHFLKHGVALSDGSEFKGDGYLRLNFGCPRKTLEELVDGIRAAARG